jgi:hypothetical protein
MACGITFINTVFVQGRPCNSKSLSSSSDKIQEERDKLIIHRPRRHHRPVDRKQVTMGTVLSQGQSSDASDTLKYFQDPQQTLTDSLDNSCCPLLSSRKIGKGDTHNTRSRTMDSSFMSHYVDLD